MEAPPPTSRMSTDVAVAKLMVLVDPPTLKMLRPAKADDEETRTQTRSENMLQG
jgi:hypothetical protein